MAVAVTTLLLALPAHAAESPAVSTARATATLISDTDRVAPGVPYHLALRLQAAPGWHIYWQNPGDAGLPPSLDFTLPGGAKAGPIDWPVPARHAEGPVMTYGYTGQTVLAVAVTAPPGPIALHATWLICANICVPEEGDFRLDLPQGVPAASAEAPLFRAGARPLPAPWPVRIDAAGTLSVAGAAIRPSTVTDAWFLPLRWGLIDQSSKQLATVMDGGLTLATKPGVEFKPDAPLPGLLVLRDPAGQETAYTVAAQPGEATITPTAPLPPLARVLLFAFLGGLILNLMPCVFPVLAIKAVGLAALHGAGRRRALVQGASFMLGVLATFLALGGLMAGLRAGGDAVGWGFQFQSPMFVAAMGWLLFAVGLNLSGTFDVSLAFGGFGHSLAHRGGAVGSFFTGLLAVLVATPCTAPFMGVAIAAALTQSAGVTLAVFAALGFGFALPFAALAAIPGASRLLPRPGAWMMLLQQVLAFPMYAAAVWLVWVLSQQAGPDGVLAAGAGLLLIGVAAWALGVAQHHTMAANRGGRATARAVALLAMAAAVGLLPTIGLAAPDHLARAEPGTEPFTAARLAALQAEGRPVFVNMTAAWCVTCLVNERLALSPDRVRQAFAANAVVTLKGDWTRQNPEVTAFLHAHGRDGVPLYIMFPANAGEPRVLPQVLTPGGMLAELGRGDVGG